MDRREFWVRWRSDIVRAAVIFGIVIGIGLFVRSLAGRGRSELVNLRQTFDTDFLAPDRQRAEPWTYATPLAAHHTLWLRNVNGSIKVEPADGHTLEVRAERTFRHSSADSVRLVTAESERGITICAVWPGGSQCGADGEYSIQGNHHGSDVAVVFTVRLPAGVQLDASTINGDLEVRDASAPIRAGTVNGDITVSTSDGPVRVASVNGDVHASILGFANPDEVNVATVHGDATLELPSRVDAVVQGHTVTGDISSDFPLTVSGKIASHDLSGTLGKGGRHINVTTVAGDVTLRRVEDVQPVKVRVEVTPPAAPAAPARPTPAPHPGSAPPHSGKSGGRWVG
jgi:Toastrack DUF4097